MAAVSALLTVCATSCEGDATPPDECDADRLDSADCGRALDARCREQATQEDCENQGPFQFSRAIKYVCNWARRVTFSEVSSCAMNEPTNVCVAVAEDPKCNCFDGCGADNRVDSLNAFKASNASDEVVILRCSEPTSVPIGPVDESILIEDDSFSYLTCSPSVQPHARPELCACREQVCDAVEGLLGPRSAAGTRDGSVGPRPG